MRLLFDQNLSFQLVRLFADVYPDSVQVRQVNLDEADDETIWRYAAAEGLTIVSKDSDFHQLSFLRGHPPKVMWLRIGNAPTAAVVALLREHFSVLQEFHADEEAAFLTLE